MLPRMLSPHPGRFPEPELRVLKEERRTQRAETAGSSGAALGGGGSRLVKEQVNRLVLFLAYLSGTLCGEIKDALQIC